MRFGKYLIEIKQILAFAPYQKCQLNVYLYSLTVPSTLRFRFIEVIYIVHCKLF